MALQALHRPCPQCFLKLKSCGVNVQTPCNKREMLQKRMKLDAMLGAVGDQPVSKPEWCVLRAYTGPLFEKYNAILRMANAAFFRQVVASLGCADNHYETTIHVLAASIHSPRIGFESNRLLLTNAPSVGG